MIKRGTTGSGITEKPALSFDDEADKTDPEIAAAIERSSLDGWLAAVESECFAIMEREGLPTYHGCYLYDRQGNWRKPGPPMRGGIANEIWPIAQARGHAPDSQVGFAARMLGDVVWLRRAKANGDDDRAAMFAGYLKAKEVERRMQVERGPLWERGLKNERDTRDGGGANRKGDIEARLARFHELQRAGVRTMEAYHRIAEEEGSSRATVGDAIRRALKDSVA